MGRNENLLFWFFKLKVLIHISAFTGCLASLQGQINVKPEEELKLPVCRTEKVLMQTTELLDQTGFQWELSLTEEGKEEGDDEQWPAATLKTRRELGVNGISFSFSRWAEGVETWLIDEVWFKML